ncbi:MAG: bifunctional methylenetetrahydrofolate dehydrogenase/methenyltetrahydrofolate cyclohydrolase FolD [Acholeplasmatales bacterium]|nr:bifunctional methylenetetrahydrofolate dehydrogenase/methenyltetrahydrofolate cyclohydrolase FolD [Acholeplasmatales bacterium]MBQ6783684.1 bifunctional methylenetetrahydrofolate dehydrogenase/methenyltetrahydrofolate cyclohydrolase FolD [Acholeplasmatales bacterium]
MAIVISGKELATLRRNKMKEEVIEFGKKYPRLPHLVVILVGEDPGSVSYVTGKGKACVEIGIQNTTIKKPVTITEDELLNLIDELNNDDTVDGILVQLPLPKHINSDLVIKRIAPEKDVDGFHPINVASLYLKQDGIVSCTPKGIIEVLDYANIQIEGRHAVVIGRSNIVGMPVSKLLLDRNATVTICHSRTANLAEITKTADILIAAVGKAKFVKADMVRDGAVVIDVGVNRDLETNKLCGDVDFKDVEPKASYITKVPGGIGPMTITCLMENTLECYLKHMEGK